MAEELPIPHYSLRKQASLDLATAEAQELLNAITLASPAAQEELLSSQTPLVSSGLGSPDEQKAVAAKAEALKPEESK